MAELMKEFDVADGTCSIDGCEAATYARSRCGTHYRQLYRSGVGVTRKRSASPEVRFWRNVEKTETCWVWTGGLFGSGYGQFWTREHKIGAHRFAYESLVGPIPEGMHLDHTCHNRKCVNPDHLRLVTNKQNHENLRGAFSDSKSGVRGVSLCKMTGRWIGFVGHNGRHYNVGRFDTIAEAEAAVIAKRNELFTHNDLDRIGQTPTTL